MKILDVYVNVNITFAAMNTSVRAESRERNVSSSFTIGELSRQFAVTTRTIRFYEDEGLLAPQRAGQNRIYTTRDRVRLKLILRGKRLGFSIKEIKDMVDMYDAPEGEVGQLKYFIERMCQRREDLLKQRNDINQVLTELDQLQMRCESMIDEQASSPVDERASSMRSA
ncbi:MAG: DNA-binding transcriptional MerR regulator [Gammaproteobacteria bacterium]|jgi:DNA-binding transcriptional MerR regulator